MTKLREKMRVIMEEEIDKELVEIFLDLQAGVKKEITFKQSDHNSRIVQVTLTKGLLSPVKLHNSRVDLYVRKKDETVAVIEGYDIDVNSGTVKFAFTRQALAVLPSIECEVVKTGNDGSVLSFPLFKAKIDTSIHNSDVVDSSNELSNLTSALLKADKANERVDEAVRTTEKKFETSFSTQSQGFNTNFNQAQTSRANEFQTWKNLAMKQEVAVNLQDQINNMPFYRIIEE